MKSILTRGLAALVLTLASLGASAQGGNIARFFCWEVTTLEGRLYLFGTIHAGKPDWYPLPPPLEKAFEESKVIAVEADITDLEDMQKHAAQMLYTPPDSLDKHVSPEDYARFRKLLARYDLPEAPMKQFKPFMAATMLVFGEWGKQGFQSAYGLDGVLITRAKEAKKQVVELEGVESQSRLVSSMTREQNRLAFSGTIKAIENGHASKLIHGMVEAWRHGNADLLLEVTRQYNHDVPGAQEFEEKLIWSRHDAMLEKIEGYLRSRQTHFVAVGALHLAGPRGLVAELRKRGYTVKPL